MRWVLWLWWARCWHRGLRVRASVLHAIYGLRYCQTGELGTRVYECPEHGPTTVANSCRRRDCPQCAGKRSFRWALYVERRLLRCPHFHVVFTLPQRLLPYWRHNRSAMARLLFDAASGTLKELLADRKYMGGTPAILGVLHTHGSALVLHPHVHVLVSSAGLSPDGRLVRTTRPKTLLPYRVLRRAFQMKLLHGLQRLADERRFHLPKGTTGPQLRRLIGKMFAEPGNVWNVMAFRRRDPRPVVRYLSRTVYGGAIRNDRIVSVTPSQVTFRYRDWRDRSDESADGSPKLKRMTLSLGEFVSRWSEHIADTGQKTVRYWGLLAPGATGRLDQARAALEQDPVPADEPDAVAPDDAPTVRCPRCAAPMTLYELPPEPVALSPAAMALLQPRAPPDAAAAA